jgi:hypothetical protein
MIDRLKSRWLKIKHWELPDPDITDGQANLMLGTGFILLGLIVGDVPGGYAIIMGMITVTIGAILG